MLCVALYTPGQVDILESNDIIAWLDIGDALTNGLDDAGALMS